MKKCTVGLLSQDREYTERLLAFIRMSEYRSIVQVAWYTDAAYCQTKLAAEQRPDLLLLDGSGELQAWINWLPEAGCPVAVLEEGGGSGLKGIPSVAKYQPLTRLMDTVLQLAGQLAGWSSSEDRRQEGPLILGVYSASGGAGKTVFAYIAAGIMGRMGCRPVVLTLESHASPCWIAGEEDRFGRALYKATGSVSEGDAEIGPELVEDHYRRIRLLPGARNPKDLEEMEEEDARRLIQGAARSFGTDAVIVDLDSSHHPRVLGALGACGRIAYLIPDHSIGRDKARRNLPRILEAVPDAKMKLSFFLSAASGQPREWDNGGQEIEEILPVQEDWRFLDDFRKLDLPTPYHSHLQKWLSGLLQPSPGWAGVRHG